MKTSTRWLIIVAAGIILLVAPSLYRLATKAGSQPTYQPPAIGPAGSPVTPVPTATPMSIAARSVLPDTEIKRGPVIVDLAHFSQVDRNRFQTLAAALASRGIDLQFWLPTADPSKVDNYTSFPDLSQALALQLADANALVVVSPVFFYNDKEIAVVKQFVADGGRLLLISDPDVKGDAAEDMDRLASAFNIVFNSDYLYDTVNNDENYTHFFQGEFFDQAEVLKGSKIAFYGGRSIGGAVIPEVRSAGTTMSSLRNGLTNFTTVAFGGQPADNSVGRVLAMSDFDVLTDPYVTRYDNRKMLDFVASFLAGAQRDNTIADFPGSLGKQIALIIDNSQPVGAAGLVKAAELQHFLEARGRTLSLAPNSWMSDTTTSRDADLIYVASYRAAADDSELLKAAGLTLIEQIVTPTVEAGTPTLAAATAAPSPQPPTPTPAQSGSAPKPTAAPGVTATVSALPLSQTVTATPKATPAPALATPAAPPAPLTPIPQAGATAAAPPASAAPTVTVPLTTTVAEQPAPKVKLYLERKDGIRLVADETQIFVQHPYGLGRKILAVLGNNEAAVNAGVTRLLNRDMNGCLIQDNLIICPVTDSGAVRTTQPTPGPTATKTPGQAAAAPKTANATVLIVDDNANAKPGEKSEAAIYLTVLTAAGYKVDLWVTGERGIPDDARLANYGWVIWSNASYTGSSIGGESLRLIGNLINAGGHVTLSSRMPFFGVGGGDPSPVKDVVVDSEVPDLVTGLPKDAIRLADDLPAVVPLNAHPEPSSGSRVAMRRGPASAAARAPVINLYSDAGFDQPKGALLLIVGMSVGWLPNDVANQLIANMAKVMLRR